MKPKRWLPFILSVFLSIGWLGFPSEAASESISLPAPLATLSEYHPRLLMDWDGFAALKDRIGRDLHLHRWYEIIKQQARDILKEPVCSYEKPDGLRLLEVSRRVMRRIYKLGLLYNLDGDSIYAERAWRELQAVAEFPDWNPAHFLDTAEMTHAMAIGYDWFYYCWNPAQRGILKNAIISKGLIPAKQLFQRNLIEDGAYWNLVCNSGVGLGALAVAEEDPELAAQIISETLRSLPNSLRNYGPDGGWDEGLGYWHYGTFYLSVYLAALTSALGTDFNLAQAPGLAETAWFPIYLSGANLSFNFGDCGTGKTTGEEVFWLARRFHCPETARWQLQNADQNPSPLDLLWYLPQSEKEFSKSPPALDKYFRKAEVATFRSSWSDPKGIFVGIKGRKNRALNHIDLDQGTFVLEASGVKWADELGADNYNLSGYFDIANWRRWTYYRKMAEGQNTLVINPNSGPDQDPSANSELTFLESKPDKAGAIVDMTKAYSRYAKQVRRGLFLLDKRRRVLLQDEVLLKDQGQICWFMHTTTKIQVLPDARTAILRQGDERLWVRILEPSGARLKIMAAKPLPKSPDPAGQSPNTDYQKLAITFSGVRNLRLALIFIPLAKGQNPPAQLPPVSTLDKMKLSW